jgi:hypothetical protein
MRGGKDSFRCLSIDYARHDQTNRAHYPSVEGILHTLPLEIMKRFQRHHATEDSTTLARLATEKDRLTKHAREMH